MKTITLAFFIFIVALTGLADFPAYVHNAYDTNDTATVDAYVLALLGGTGVQLSGTNIWTRTNTFTYLKLANAPTAAIAGMAVLDANGNIFSNSPPGSAAYRGTNDFSPGVGSVMVDWFSSHPLAMSTIYDAAVTSGSPTLTSASANFTSEDVGKSLVIYSDAYNTNYVICTISAVGSTTSATLSTNIPWAGTGLMANYGFDATIPIQSAIDYCYANGVHQLLLSNEWYMAAGLLSHTGTNQDSVFSFPHASYTQTNKLFVLQIKGVSPANFDFSGYFQYAAPRSGSGIYCPTKQTATTNCIVFGMSNTNTTFTSFGVDFQNIAFCEPCAPQLTVINDAWGGRLTAERCSWFPDFSAGKINAVWGGNGATAIVLPFSGNSAVNGLSDCSIINFDTAIHASEHAYCDNVLVGANVLGLMTEGGTGVTCHNLMLVNNYTNLAFPSSGFGQIYGEIYTEDSVGIVKANIYVPNDGAAVGRLTVNLSGSFLDTVVAGVRNKSPAKLIITCVNATGTQNAQTVGRFRSDGTASTNAAKDIVIGGAYATSGNVGLFSLSDYDQSVRRMATGGEYGFNESGVQQYGWNLSAANSAASQGSLTLSNFTALGKINGNGPGLTNADLSKQNSKLIPGGTAVAYLGTNSSGALVMSSPSGVGTVTSVTFTGDGTVLSSTPSSAVTSSGTVTGTLLSQSANTVFGNFTGSSATPTFSASPVFSGEGLTTLNASALTSGTVGTARLGTGTADSTTYLRGDGTWNTPSGGGGGGNVYSNTATAFSSLNLTNQDVTNTVSGSLNVKSNLFAGNLYNLTNAPAAGAVLVSDGSPTNLAFSTAYAKKTDLLAFTNFPAAGGFSVSDGTSTNLYFTTFLTNSTTGAIAPATTNTFVSGQLYTNGNYFSFLVGAARLTGAVTGSAQAYINYTNNGFAGALQIETGLLAITNCYPFCIPLGPGATFKINLVMASGASGYVTNTANWRQQ